MNTNDSVSQHGGSTKTIATFSTEDLPASGAFTLKRITYLLREPVIIPSGVRIQVEPVTPGTSSPH